MCPAGTHHQAVPQCFRIVHANPFQVCIGQDRSTVVAHHAVTMAGTGPLREETALAVSIQKSLLHLPADGRIHQVQQRKETAERIPQPGSGVIISRQHLPCRGTVMHDLSAGIHFMELVREKQRTIQTGVERAVLIQRSPFHFHTSQHLVPAFPALLR